MPKLKEFYKKNFMNVVMFFGRDFQSFSFYFIWYFYVVPPCLELTSKEIKIEREREKRGKIINIKYEGKKQICQGKKQESKTELFLVNYGDYSVFPGYYTALF
jgi:hypothetical protein